MHPLGDDGSVGGAPTAVVDTAVGAHAMQTDRSNRFAYVPHIAPAERQRAWNRPGIIPAPNFIYQFRFDADTGALTPNSPLEVAQDGDLGPRHFCFHPTLDVVYFSNEQGCSVSAYQIDEGGRLTAMQNCVNAAGRGYGAEHLLADSALAVRGFSVRAEPGAQQHRRFRAVDAEGPADSGRPRGHRSPCPARSAWTRRAAFVFAAGSATGQLASYRINGDTGELTPLGTYAVGERPMWVLTTTLDG